MFDAVTLAAVADELREQLLHGRVQEIVQLDALAFGFEIYAQHARRYLYIGVHPEEARLHLAPRKLRGSGQAPSAMLLLLRKFAVGAFLDRIEQIPNERVLSLFFDHAAEGQTELVVETIGRYSNLILVDAGGTVVDALKRVSPAMNRTRVTLPGQAYVPPPPQAKLDPSALTVARMTSLLEKNRGARLSQVLVQNIAGTSPLVGRELAFRAGGSIEALADPADAAEVLRLRQELARPPWEPTLALEDGEPAEYAPFTLRQYEERRPYDSISAAMNAFYGEGEAYAAAKEPLREKLAAARDRLARKRDALAQSLPLPEAVEGLRTHGELVLAHAFQIKPGDKVLRADTEQGTIEIPLDPTLSPVENAQKLFKEYHRVKDAAARVPPLLDAAGAEVDYAEQMLNDLELAESRAEIDAVIVAAREAGWAGDARPRSQVTASEPRTVISQDGFTILIGKNAKQNEEITFRRARPDDWWLHVRNGAGAHVVIVRAGRDVPETTLQQAAQLAAYYSQSRGEARVDVMVTARKNVHRLRGHKAGMVTVRESRIVNVEPESNSHLVL